MNYLIKKMLRMPKSRSKENTKHEEEVKSLSRRLFCGIVATSFFAAMATYLLRSFLRLT